MTNPRTTTGVRTSTQCEKGIGRKAVSLVCAMVLALSLGIMVPLDQVMPDRFEGGQAYAAQSGSLKAGSAGDLGALGAADAKPETTSLKSQSTESLLQPGIYRITSAASPSLAVDVPEGRANQDLQLQLWSVNGLTPQTYVFKQVSTNIFTIQSACSGKYLTDIGGRVVQQSIQPYPWGQSWRVVQEGSRRALRNLATGRMLAITSALRGSKLITRNQSWANYEQWDFTPVNLIPNGCYTLDSAVGNNQMLDVSAASRANNANVQIYSGNGLNVQKWQVSHAYNGYYKLVNAASGKALDVDYKTGNAQQYTNANYSSELWRAEVADDGGFIFVNMYNGRTLTVVGSSSRAGTNVTTYAKSGSAGQRWYLTPTEKIKPRSTRRAAAGIIVTERVDYNGVKMIDIPSRAYTVRNVMGRMLDVSANSSAAGTNVQIWEATKSNAQKWYFVPAGNGYYYLKNSISGMALDVMNGWTGNGTNVRMWYSNNSAAQRWKAELVGNDLVFINEASGKALDVSANVNANGRNVQIWERNNCTAQRWKLSPTKYNRDGFVNVKECYNTLNAYRLNSRVRRATRDIALENYAKQRARELVTKFSSVRPNGENSIVAIKRLKRSVLAAENIAKNCSSCSIVMAGWKNTPAACKRMLDPKLTRVGIAGFKCDGRMYWVQVFSR